MNQQPQRDRNRTLTAVIWTAGVVAIAVTVWLLVLRDRVGRVVPPPDPDGGLAMLRLTRTALAATENLETEAAAESWEELFRTFPDDPSVALNRAINRVLTVRTLTETATETDSTADEKTAARARVAAAIDAARGAIDDFETAADANDAASTENPKATWLRTRVNLHEAVLLPKPMTRSIRRDTIETLAEAIGESNRAVTSTRESVALGGLFLESAERLETLDGLPDDIQPTVVKTVALLSDQHPDNSYFALSAVLRHVEARSPETTRFVRRVAELVSAIKPSVARDLRGTGMTLDGLVDAIAAAVDEDDYTRADFLTLQFFNVLNKTELVKTDRRRAMPHPLDRLSFDSLRRLSIDAVDRRPIQPGEATIKFDEQVVAPDFKPAAVATIDYDLDLRPELVIAGDGQVQLLAESDGAFARVASIPIERNVRGLLIADLFLVDSTTPDRLEVTPGRTTGPAGQSLTTTARHDTLQHVVAWGDDGVAVIAVDGRETTTEADRLRIIDSPTGLESIRSVTAAAAGDLEADGDLDLIFATADGQIRFFVNRGNRTFFELESAVRLPTAAAAIAIGDLDRDLDLDLVTAHPEDGRIGWIENLLHLQFRGRLIDDIPAIKGVADVRVEDVDGSVSWDLIVAGDDIAAVVFGENPAAGVWNVGSVQTGTDVTAPIAVGDLDNDSYLDVISGTTGKVVPIGPFGFGESVASVRTGAEVAVDDFDRDGKIDLVVVAEGAVAIGTNRTEGVSHFVDVRFRGIDDNVSGRVNHYAIGSVLETRFGPHYRARVVTSATTHFGLDGFERAGSIRAILPNGLTQTIRDPAPDSLIEEEQTLKGSCPYLYAWNGEEFAFLTDCLWAAPLGLQVARGVVAKDRPWEYLKLDGDSIRPIRNERVRGLGEYELRITEELWEIAYFDHVALTAVDHPIGTQVWTNEKVGPAGIAEPAIFAFENSQVQAVVSATSSDGDDITGKLRGIDRDFVVGFDRRIRQGLCPPHRIDLDFGEQVVPAGASAYLVLTGWILPTDTSLNIQIDQNPAIGPVEYPSLWVPDEDSDGGWRRAIDFIGFPGGKTKTIVVDVTEVVDRANAGRLSVRTSAQIYWDAAQFVVQPEPAEFIQRDVKLISARVEEHGYSRKIRPSTEQPETYDYQDASMEPRWPPLNGPLTRRGNCLDLLTTWDDRMAVISGGDEIRLRFAVPAEPVPAGWRRDFILHSVGWDKDADLNTFAGQSTLPLPYREMSSYPPPPTQTGSSEQRRTLNADHLNRRQHFRAFWRYAND